MTKLNNESISIKQMEELLDNRVQQTYEHIHELQTLKKLIHNVVKPWIRPNDYVSLVMYALECHGVDYFNKWGYKKAAEELSKEVNWTVDQDSLRKAISRVWNKNGQLSEI